MASFGHVVTADCLLHWNWLHFFPVFQFQTSFHRLHEWHCVTRPTVALHLCSSSEILPIYVSIVVWNGNFCVWDSLRCLVLLLPPLSFLQGTWKSRSFTECGRLLLRQHEVVGAGMLRMALLVKACICFPTEVTWVNGRDKNVIRVWWCYLPFHFFLVFYFLTLWYLLLLGQWCRLLGFSCIKTLCFDIFKTTSRWFFHDSAYHGLITLRVHHRFYFRRFTEWKLCTGIGFQKWILRQIFFDHIFETRVESHAWIKFYPHGLVVNWAPFTFFCTSIGLNCVDFIGIVKVNFPNFFIGKLKLIIWWNELVCIWHVVCAHFSCLK